MDRGGDGGLDDLLDVKPLTGRDEANLVGENGRAVIEVSDDGPGVTPAIAPRIFDPLVTGRSGGSGLGLALAKRIVAAHGGTITLAEPREGVTGATFRIELPAV